MANASDCTTYVIHLSDSEEDDIKFDSTDNIQNVYVLSYLDDMGNPYMEDRFPTRAARDRWLKDVIERGWFSEALNEEWLCDCWFIASEVDGMGNEVGEVEVSCDIDVVYVH